jgi:hypothetical protein
MSLLRTAKLIKKQRSVIVMHVNVDCTWCDDCQFLNWLQSSAARRLAICNHGVPKVGMSVCFFGDSYLTKNRTLRRNKIISGKTCTGPPRVVLFDDPNIILYLP